MLGEDRQPDATEAKENLRIIRDLMERSTKYSTFSGPSGVIAGLASIGGCAATRSLSARQLTAPEFREGFLLAWCLVIFVAVGADYVLTKRRAARVGKYIVSRLGKQMIIAAAPGLGAGAALTLFFVQSGAIPAVYPVWMLCYGVAVCAVGLFSQREVSILGAAFLIAGAVTLRAPQYGLAMVAATFGGFHILYGIAMTRKGGW